jgi:hypothetical protein
MMHGADAQEGCLAEPVGDARVDQPGPELCVALGVGTEQGDMAEIGDANLSSGEVLPAAVVGACQNLDLVAAGIG